MYNVKVFQNPAFGEIRTTGTADKPLFCLADVCKVLGLQTKHVKERLEDGVVSTDLIHDTIGREQVMYFVNEDGLYDVILDSRKPEAKKFRKWVTSEVLPSIRKTGGYITASTDMTDEEIMAKALNIANETIKRRNERIIALESENQALTEQNTVMLPKVRAYEQVINTPQTEWLKTTQQVANEIGMSANKLNKLLIAANVIYKTATGEYLVTSNYAKWGLHNIVSYPIGEKRVKTYIKWTERGRLYIHALHDCQWNKQRAWRLVKFGKEEAVS